MNHIEAKLTHRTDSTTPVRCQPLTRDPRIGGILARLTATACHLAARTLFSQDGRCDASLKKAVATRRRAPSMLKGSPSSFGRKGAIHPHPSRAMGAVKRFSRLGAAAECQPRQYQEQRRARANPWRVRPALLPFSVTRMISGCRRCRGCGTVESLN
jgi:hypothetical protein